MATKNLTLNQSLKGKSQQLSPPSQKPGLAPGLSLAGSEGMALPPILAVRHVQAAGRKIPVFLTRNEGGSVAARCVLDKGDTPIIDGASMDEVLRLLQDAIESLLIARMRTT